MQTSMYVHHEKIFICNLATNLRGAYGDFTRVVKQLYNVHTNQWFLHWENCQKDGAKAARQFYRRPYFISNSLDLTGSNWVLMSSDFRGRVYKKIDPSETLMMLYQIRGFNHIRLSPRDACRDNCPELLTTLNEGEILVVENLLWIMEYIPGEEGDNLGIISEVSWPSME
ncbi:unnamed protein product [Allacma fusca]|uniref:Uncharacterized protein n=1 Tax=Allacma fusca TaxID=39272 RepID=A0A8J2K7Z4_9HEXA|nr:unnamed protein product [Allacma fusca]